MKNDDITYTVLIVFNDFKTKSMSKGLTLKDAEKLRDVINTEWKGYKDFHVQIVEDK